jgi:hypothetical protein
MLRLDTDAIVDGSANSLFATEMTLGSAQKHVRAGTEFALTPLLQRGRALRKIASSREGRDRQSRA